MNMDEAIATMKLALRTDSYTQPDIIRAMRAALNELNRQCDIVRVQGSKNLTANSNEVDLSTVTGFLPNRLRIAEIGYNDRSTWLTAQSYAINDLVQGDGSPDAYLYVCTVAHTSAAGSGGNEPPNNSYWARVENKRGTRLKVRPYDEVVGDGGNLGGSVRPYSWRHRPFVQWNNDTSTVHNRPLTPDRPLVIAFPFPTATTAFVRPTPKLAYPLVLIYRKPLQTLDPNMATPSSVTLDVPDEYLDMVLNVGGPAFLEYPDEQDRRDSPMGKDFAAFIQSVKDQTSERGAVTQRRPNFNGA